MLSALHGIYIQNIIYYTGSDLYLALPEQKTYLIFIKEYQRFFKLFFTNILMEYCSIVSDK